MTKTTCPRCGHKWTYKGQAHTITCPSCRKMFKNTEFVSKNVQEDTVEIEKIARPIDANKVVDWMTPKGPHPSWISLQDKMRIAFKAALEKGMFDIEE